MTIEIKAPTLPESVPDGTIATWYKKPGESVARDELLVDIETDKVVLVVVAPGDGVLKDIQKVNPVERIVWLIPDDPNNRILACTESLGSGAFCGLGPGVPFRGWVA